MAEVKWIKLCTKMFDDEKIKIIESMPDKDTLLIIWIKLILQAGITNAGGYIYLTENIAFTDEMLAAIFNRPVNTIRLALDTFRKLEMIELDEKGIFIPSFERIQNKDGLEKIREQTRQRVQEHRKKKKQESLPSGDTCNVTGNVTVTQGNALELDLELDKDISSSSSIGQNFFENRGNCGQNVDKSVDNSRPMRKVNQADIRKLEQLYIETQGLERFDSNTTKMITQLLTQWECKYIEQQMKYTHEKIVLYAKEFPIGEKSIKDYWGFIYSACRENYAKAMVSYDDVHGIYGGA